MQTGMKESQEPRRERYRGTVEGLGYSWGWMGRVEQMLVLRGIVTEDGQMVTDSTTLRVGKNLMQLLPLAEGDMIAFHARLVDIVEDQYPNVAIYKAFRQPTRLEVLSRQATS